MSASPYLDHLYSVFDFTEDEGYDTSTSSTSHYTFNRTLTRKSDFSITPHICSNKNIYVKQTTHFHENRIGVPNCHDFETTELNYCDKCGWWEVKHKIYNHLSSHAYESKTETYGGTKKVFSNPEKMDAITEIECLLRLGDKQLNSINPILFEKSLASVFSNYYMADVKHIGGPGDNGIDLYCIIGEETFLIQVKRRSNGKAEAVSVIRDLIGAYALASNTISTSRHSAHLITSAPHFSKNATQSSQSESLSKFDFSIGIHAYKELLEIFGFASGSIDDPWNYLRLKGHMIDGELVI